MPFRSGTRHFFPRGAVRIPLQVHSNVHEGQLCLAIGKFKISGRFSQGLASNHGFPEAAPAATAYETGTGRVILLPPKVGPTRISSSPASYSKRATFEINLSSAFLTNLALQTDRLESCPYRRINMGQNFNARRLPIVG